MQPCYLQASMWVNTISTTSGWVKTPAGIHAEKGVAGTSWSILPLKANKHYLHRQILRGTIEHFHWFDIQVLGWMVLMWFQRHNQTISHFWEIVCTHGLTDYHRSQWYGGTRNNTHAGQQCGGNRIQPECIPVSPINKPLLLSGQLNGHTPFTWVSAILYTSFCLVVYHGMLVRKVMISGVWLARKFVQGCISNTNHVNDALNSIVPINASL